MYKSDDMDDLLEGVITNTHKDKQEDDKPKGAVDTLVQEELDKANAQAKQEEKEHPKEKEVKKVSQEEEWAKLMQEPDPL